MTTIAKSTRSSPERQPLRARSLDRFFSPLDELARHSVRLTATPLGRFSVEDETYALRRYLHVGPSGGDAPIRLGIFAGIHGHEPAPAYALRRFIHMLEDYPEIARGYCLAGRKLLQFVPHLWPLAQFRPISCFNHRRFCPLG